MTSSTGPDPRDTAESEGGEDLWFSEAWIEQGRIALRAARDLPASFAVHAIVGGIRIGTHDHAGDAPPRAGEVLEIACGYYPNKGLPNEIRFAMSGSDDDAAPAIPLTSISQVIKLVGYDRLDEGTLHVADGILRGTALNRSNAHRKFQPPLVCRINGQEMREVTLDAVTPHPGGGAWLSFSVPIRPTDIFESGAFYEILALPALSPVAAKRYSPAPGLDDASDRLIALEAQVAQLERRLIRDVTEARDAARSAHRDQLRLLDSFAEYMLAMIFDRFASGGDMAPASPEEDAAIAAFRKLAAAGRDDAPVVAPSASVTLTLPSVAANRGWYTVETRKKGAGFVWMSRNAGFQNPYPDTPVAMVSVAVQSVVSPDVLPVSALFDGELAEMEVLPDLETFPFRVNFRPRGGAAKPVRNVELISDRALSPREVGTSQDARKLSVAVSSVSLHFDLESDTRNG